jgi:hypothetical protein
LAEVATRWHPPIPSPLSAPSGPLYRSLPYPPLGELWLAKGERMTEEGTLSIVRRGTVYQVRYASNNPYAPDRAPRACHDADTLGAFLHQ